MHNSRCKRIRIFLFLIILLGAFPAFPENPAQEQSSDCVIIADFSETGGNISHRAAGILHSFHTNEPPDSLVLPLKLQAFRGRANDTYLFSKGFYRRIQRIGVKHIQVVLSDSYGYPNGFAGWPCNEKSWAHWEHVVESVVKECQKQKMVVEYDIWNEPDICYFWGGDLPTWLETWKRGFQKVRSLDKNAVIVGPSISGMNLGFFKQFLIYARNNDCLPDVLSWHELGALNPQNIPRHIRQIEDLLTSESIAISRFSINEIIPERGHFSPGVAACYLAVIEGTSVESACRSCWNDVNGNNGENRSLDGLLTHDTKQPRSVWWAFKGYADISGCVIKTTRKGAAKAFVQSLAGYDADGKFSSFIIGNCDAKKEVSLTIQLRHLEKAKGIVHGGLFKKKHIHVSIENIPPTGTQELKSPELIFDGILPVKDNACIISPKYGIPPLKPDSALIIKISGEK